MPGWRGTSEAVMRQVGPLVVGTLLPRSVPWRPPSLSLNPATSLGTGVCTLWASHSQSPQKPRLPSRVLLLFLPLRSPGCFCPRPESVLLPCPLRDLGSPRGCRALPLPLPAGWPVVVVQGHVEGDSSGRVVFCLGKVESPTLSHSPTELPCWKLNWDRFRNAT